MRIPIGSFFRALFSGFLLTKMRKRFGVDPNNAPYIRDGAQN